MNNPGARKNVKKAVFMNWSNNNLKEIKVLSAGEKIRDDEQPTIESTAAEYKINYDPEKNRAERIVNGEIIKVNDKYMRKIYNLRKQQGRPIKTVKGTQTKSQNDQAKEDR